MSNILRAMAVSVLVAATLSCTPALTIELDCPSNISAGGSGTILVNVADTGGLPVAITEIGSSSRSDLTIIEASDSATVSVAADAVLSDAIVTIIAVTEQGQVSSECTIQVTCAVGCATDADCDDGDPCTDEECTGDCGDCVSTPVECPDGVMCLDGVCLVCTDESCDDGNACNGIETCERGLCAVGEPLDCDDSLDCTDDACDADVGCTHTSTCADGVFCTSDGCCGCETNGDCPTGFSCVECDCFEK
jgi:hypothetical protein